MCIIWCLLMAGSSSPRIHQTMDSIIAKRLGMMETECRYPAGRWGEMKKVKIKTK